MAEAVNTKRRYDSSRRREQAAATRREILAAAQRLFAERGYAATTMAAIAEEAGVSLKTVYLAFDGKSGVLRALWHLLVRGEQDSVPIPQQAWFQEVVAEPDPVRKLEIGSRNSRIIKERAGDLMEALRSGAPTDPDLAELWGRIQSEFRENMRRIVELLPLRDGLDVEEAADTMWAINHPDMWRLLVVERGWSAERYERWLVETLTVLLLSPRRSRRARRSAPAAGRSPSGTT